MLRAEDRPSQAPTLGPCPSPRPSPRQRRLRGPPSPLTAGQVSPPKLIRGLLQLYTLFFSFIDSTFQHKALCPAQKNNQLYSLPLKSSQSRKIYKYHCLYRKCRSSYQATDQLSTHNFFGRTAKQHHLHNATHHQPHVTVYHSLIIRSKLERSNCHPVTESFQSPEF